MTALFLIEVTSSRGLSGPCRTTKRPKPGQLASSTTNSMKELGTGVGILWIVHANQ